MARAWGQDWDDGYSDGWEAAKSGEHARTFSADESESYRAGFSRAQYEWTHRDQHRDEPGWMAHLK